MIEHFDIERVWAEALNSMLNDPEMCDECKQVIRSAFARALGRLAADPQQKAVPPPSRN